MQNGFGVWQKNVVKWPDFSQFYGFRKPAPPVKSAAMLATKLTTAIAPLLPAACDFTLEIPPNPKFGDFACNAALLLARSLGRPPRELAAEVALKLESLPEIAKVEIAGPGFLNLFLRDDYIWRAVPPAAEPPAAPQPPRKVLVEYGQENIAKPMSVGHLRSNLIGRSLVEIHRFLGWQVITDNHLGDWGTQFGKLIVALRRWGDRQTVAADPIPELNALYIRFHEEAEKDPTLEDEARAEFAKLEAGDAENRATWQWLRDESLHAFQKMYARLGSQFDHFHGEAFFEPDLPRVIAELQVKGIAVENPDGSIMIPFPPEVSQSPLLIQKSDGATLYATRDLAAVRFYVREFAPDLVLQCVGAEQSLHFRQFYDAARRAGWMGETQFVHVTNGLVRLPEGKMSTRKGRTIQLEQLLDEAEEKMRAVLTEKNCEIAGEAREQLIRDLALGAVKFADLGRARESTITFTWESALSFEGYAAPYLMYTHARACSILRRVPAADVTDFAQFSDPAERALALLLDRFTETVQAAASSYHPHVVAQFIYEVAQSFNTFYHRLPVAQATGTEQAVRRQLVATTADVLRVGLGLLGIAAPERM